MLYLSVNDLLHRLPSYCQVFYEYELTNDNFLFPTDNDLYTEDV